MGINRDQKIVASFQQAAELNALYLLCELLWGWGVVRSAASLAGKPWGLRIGDLQMALAARRWPQCSTCSHSAPCRNCS